MHSSPESHNAVGAEVWVKSEACLCRRRCGATMAAAFKKACGLAFSMTAFLPVSTFLGMGVYCTVRMVILKCVDGRVVVWRHRACRVRARGLQYAEYGA